MASCFCSVLLHVVACLIFTILVSCQLVLIQLFQNFFSVDVSRFLSFCLRVQISLPYKRMRGASALYFILENFWTKVGLKVLFRIPSIWANDGKEKWGRIWGRWDWFWKRKRHGDTTGMLRMIQEQSEKDELCACFLDWQEGIWPCKLDVIDAGPKGKWYRLARKKVDEQFVNCVWLSVKKYDWTKEDTNFEHWKRI